MLKIGFVTPWFGMDIPGGAEAELRGLILHLKEEKDIEIEVLTTCIKEFKADWNTNYYKQGIEQQEGFIVRRFEVRKRNTALFDSINYKFMQGLVPPKDEQLVYLKESVNSDALYEYMMANKNEYDLFVFIPYMFGTTYYGCQICPEKSVVIPCLHDESYAYMEPLKNAFNKVAGMIFHARPEQDLATRVYGLENVSTAVLGEGVYTDLRCYPQNFRDKYNIKTPFILYAGRKEAGKRVDLLIQYFAEFKKRNNSSVKLILIGGGEIAIPNEMKDEILDLGFIDIQDKYNAYGASTLLCQPSEFESFSLVIMESWLCNRPVLVNNKCEVTKNFAKESQGGLYFDNYFEFEGALNYYLEHPSIADEMGYNGRNFVMSNFAWDVIVDRYKTYFDCIIKV